MRRDPNELVMTFLSATAERGARCPSMPTIAKSLELSVESVERAIGRLVAAGRITSRVCFVRGVPGSRWRTVTIAATGKSTQQPPAEPVAKKRKNPPGSAWIPGWVIDRDPDDLCGGRRLSGAEFQARAAELMARDAAERARREQGI